MTVALAARPAGATGAYLEHTCPAGSMLIYDVGDELARNKKAIVEACKQLQATDEQTRLAVAVAMGETQTCCVTQRDATKDCTVSANYSCFNMNKDMLEQVGWHDGGTDLNKNENVLHAVGLLMAAYGKYGLEGFLNFHRGGRTALDDGRSYGAQEYREKIKVVMQELAYHPEHLTDGVRLGFDIPHV